MKDITTQIKEAAACAYADRVTDSREDRAAWNAPYYGYLEGYNAAQSAILKDRRELVEKAIEMARENNEGVEITICPEMKYTQQQILEKLEVSDV